MGAEEYYVSQPLESGHDLRHQKRSADSSQGGAQRPALRVPMETKARRSWGASSAVSPPLSLPGKLQSQTQIKRPGWHQGEAPAPMIQFLLLATSFRGHTAQQVLNPGYPEGSVWPLQISAATSLSLSRLQLWDQLLG